MHPWGRWSVLPPQLPDAWDDQVGGLTPKARPERPLIRSPRCPAGPAGRVLGFVAHLRQEAERPLKGRHLRSQPPSRARCRSAWMSGRRGPQGDGNGEAASSVVLEHVEHRSVVSRHGEVEVPVGVQIDEAAVDREVTDGGLDVRAKAPPPVSRRNETVSEWRSRSSARSPITDH